MERVTIRVEALDRDGNVIADATVDAYKPTVSETWRDNIVRAAESAGRLAAGRAVLPGRGIIPARRAR